MAVTLLGRKYATTLNQGVSDTLQETLEYTVVYIVQTTDDCADEYDVMNAEGLPQIYDRSELYPACRVESRSATEVEKGVWEVTINYRIPEPYKAANGGGGGGGLGAGAPGGQDVDPTTDKEIPEDSPTDKKPWEKGTKVTITTGKKKTLLNYAVYLGIDLQQPLTPTQFGWTRERDVYRDPSGVPYVPVTNSAGEFIYYDTERVIINVTFEEALEKIDNVYEMLKNVGSVSLDPIPIAGVVWPEFSVYLEDATLSEDFYTDTETGETSRFWNVSFKYVIDMEGHYELFADVGSMHFPTARTSSDTFASATVYKNAENEIITGPLNGQGGQGAAGEVVYLRYCPYPIRRW